jgi:hypothetical protein
MAVRASVLSKARLTVGRDFICVWGVTPDPGLPADNDDVTTDLTGATVTAAIVDTDAAATAIVPDTAITCTVDAPTRAVVMTIGADDTDALVPGVYRWSVYVTLTGGEKYEVTGLGPAQVFAA